MIFSKDITMDNISYLFVLVVGIDNIDHLMRQSTLEVIIVFFSFEKKTEKQTGEFLND